MLCRVPGAMYSSDYCAFPYFGCGTLESIIHSLPVSSLRGRWNCCGVQVVRLWRILTYTIFKGKLEFVSDKHYPDRCFLRCVLRTNGPPTCSMGEGFRCWNGIWEMLPIFFLFRSFIVHIIKLKILESLSEKNPASLCLINYSLIYLPVETTHPSSTFSNQVTHISLTLSCVRFSQRLEWGGSQTDELTSNGTLEGSATGFESWKAMQFRGVPKRFMHLLVQERQKLETP